MVRSRNGRDHRPVTPLTPPPFATERPRPGPFGGANRENDLSSPMKSTLLPLTLVWLGQFRRDCSATRYHQADMKNHILAICGSVDLATLPIVSAAAEPFANDAIERYRL